SGSARPRAPVPVTSRRGAPGTSRSAGPEPLSSTLPPCRRCRNRGRQRGGGPIVAKASQFPGFVTNRLIFPIVLLYARDKQKGAAQTVSANIGESLMIRSAGRTSIKAAKTQFGAGLRGSASVLALGAMFSGSAA